MTTQHTPGPWKVPGSTVVQNSEGEDEIAYIVLANGMDMSAANANLIAAAPALLEAAKAALSALRNFTMFDGKIPDNLVVLAQEAARQVLAAIAAAEGRKA